MICTIDDAKRKICPQMSGWIPSSILGNVAEWVFTYCQTDQCALW
jgi:hypothetical protein